MIKPEVTVPRCAERFDEEGQLIDSTTRELVRQLVTALPLWIARFR
jgi:hypothetical protein